MITDEQLNGVAYALLGTCCSLEEIFYREMGYEIYDLSSANEDRLLAELDRVTFNCATCGWWCEMGSGGDKDGEWICEQCEPEGDEDD